MKKSFFLNCSTKAIRTIKKYGGLDRYLLTTSDKFIQDSQFAQYLKSILIKKQKDPNFRLRYIPFTRKPRFVWKKRERSEVKGIPSIYIPPEAKRMDLSEMYYPIDYFETRLEKQKRQEVEKQLEQESDPVKRDELKKQLNLERYTNKVKKDLLALMPIRQKWIRDGLVRLRERPTVKLNFLKTLENSENYTKLMLGDQYKHFSEDYPEVQLILQQTEQDKFKKQRGVGKLYKGYSYDFGETYEESKKSAQTAFEPFEKKAGQKWEKPAKRLNAKMIEKIKTRSDKKEKKLNQKKVEKRKATSKGLKNKEKNSQ
jgi:hypothetical protein